MTGADLDSLLAAGEFDWTPERLAYPGAWAGHLPFAFWLVGALRPDLVVELGTHSGNSYFSFCQALAALHPAGRAYAVDTWKGDEHAGFYGEDVFADVSAYNEAHYAGFSTLLRQTFDAARPYFADGSIDLLHIDGMHSYEQVRYDFESWQAAVSPRGVVLFHDIGVRENGFGVWRLWDELTQRFPSFAFTHSHGLGVLGVGPGQPPALHALFGLADDPAAAGRVRRRVAARGEAFQHLVELSTAKHWLRVRSDEAAAAGEALARQETAVERLQLALAGERGQDRMQAARIAALEDAAARADSVAKSRAAALEARDGEIAALRDALREAERRQDNQVGEMAARHEADRVAAAQTVRRLQDELAAATAHQQHLVQEYVTSTSWRVTRPLRLVTRLARRPAAAPPPAAPPPAVVPSDLAALKAATRAVLRLRLDAFLASGARLRFAAPEQPAVSIVLVLYNQAELTLACLASILEVAEPDGTQLVIVDNASTDRTGALLGRIDGATILRNVDNRHFLRAMNQGAAAVQAPVMLLLNNDAQLLPGSLAAALRTLRSSPDTGAVGGRIILPDGTLQEAGSIIWQNGACAGYGRGADPAAPEYGFRRDVDFCSGAFLLTWTSLWQMLGGFDERYAPAYYEEVDYCVRLWKAGFRVVFDPAASIVHFEFGSSARSGDALALQAANFAVFRDCHAVWLQGQRPIEDGPLLARAARGTTLRVLVIDGADGIAALLDRGALVTVLEPLSSPILHGGGGGAADGGGGIPHAVGEGVESRVERIVASDPAAFLASRPGYYGAIVTNCPQLAGHKADAIILDGAGLAAFLAATPLRTADPADALPASRPAESDFALSVPFGFAPLAAPAPRVAVIGHLFYPEIAAELLTYLANIPGDADLYLSTDTEAKRALLHAATSGWDRGTVDLRVMPNRGRDIAPKLVGFASAHAGYDLVLHVHSKRSDHTGFLAPWRRFLYETLLGSPATVASIMDAFARLPRLGMLAPLHYEGIRRWIGWNGNLPQARALAERMGVSIQPGRALDFPSGSMFWARPAALAPLLDLGLGFGDFPEEGGQEDHTTAHAIERLFFYSCERSGHDWLKIADPALFHDASAIVPVKTPDGLQAFARDHGVRLTGTAPIAVRPDPAPMQTEVPPGLAARLRLN